MTARWKRKKKARVRFPPSASLDSRGGSDYAQNISAPGVHKPGRDRRQRMKTLYLALAAVILWSSFFPVWEKRGGPPGGGSNAFRRNPAPLLHSRPRAREALLLRRFRGPPLPLPRPPWIAHGRPTCPPPPSLPSEGPQEPDHQFVKTSGHLILARGRDSHAKDIRGWSRPGRRHSHGRSCLSPSPGRFLDKKW
jgi:hypothetical protein